LPTVSTTFTLPCPQDRAVLAIQDVLNQFQWNVMTLSTSEVAATLQPMPSQAFRVKLTATMKERDGQTLIGVTTSVMFGVYFDGKKRCTEMMGTFVNALSLRVQTQSIAINPTVAIGEGQASSSEMPPDRVSQLVKLKELFDAGVLTDSEFQDEKARILNQT
jgi:hypothetical protein